MQRHVSPEFAIARNGNRQARCATSDTIDALLMLFGSVLHDPMMSRSNPRRWLGLRGPVINVTHRDDT